MKLELTYSPMGGQPRLDEPPDQRRRAGINAAVGQRLVALDEAIAMAAGRLDTEQQAPARELSRRAAQRLRLSSSHTVVALAGATGSGKSSIFNAMVGAALSEAGVRRPTTGVTHAAIWGAGGAGPLLDWLQIPQRHYLDGADRTGQHGHPRDHDPLLDGLVLLDLPDHDSINHQHREEVDRLVKLVDLLVWVLDPQKYADAAVHERYLRPLAGQADTMVVLLNQADRLPAHQVESAVQDVQRLLAADGLGPVPVLATSAVTPGGVDHVREALRQVVSMHHAALTGIAADLDTVTIGLSGFVGDAALDQLDNDTLDDVAGELTVASGAAAFSVAAAQDYRRRAGECRASATPRWLLDRLRHRGSPDVPERTSDQPASPAPCAVDRSGVDLALRSLSDRVSAGLPDPWPETIRSATRSRAAELTVALDDAVGRSVRQPVPTSTAWRLIGVLRALLIVVAGIGGAWLLGEYALGLLRSSPAAATLSGAGIPTLLLGGGALGWLVLGGLARIAAAVGAHRHARQAEAQLHRDVREVANELVIQPVRSELAAYETMRSILGRLRRA